MPPRRSCDDNMIHNEPDAAMRKRHVSIATPSPPRFGAGSSDCDSSYLDKIQRRPLGGLAHSFATRPQTAFIDRVTSLDNSENRGSFLLEEGFLPEGFQLSPKHLRFHLDKTSPGNLEAFHVDMPTDQSQLEGEDNNVVSESSEFTGSFNVDERSRTPKKVSLETLVLLASETTYDGRDAMANSRRSSFSSRKAQRPELGVLSSVASFEGALYYIRNCCVEKVQLEQLADVDFSLPPPGSHPPEEAQILRPAKGVPSYFTWDNRSTHAERTITLDEDDSAATPIHQSIQGAVVGLASFSQGIHCWSMRCSDLQSVAFGIVSKVGIDSFYECRSGAIPNYVACLRPGPHFEHRVHWLDAYGRERWKLVDPPLSSYGRLTNANVSVVLNFYHKEISFLFSERLICSLSFAEDEVNQSMSFGQSDPFQLSRVFRDTFASSSRQSTSMLLGDHTVFAHVKHGTKVKLIQHYRKAFEGLAPTDEGVPAPKILAGNPYARWGIVDGQGAEAVFSLPLGICVWNNFVWVTDCNAIRQIDQRGVVTTYYPKLVPDNCQPPIQYLGAIHPMRNKLFVTDLTNRTILCVDPATWEARLVLTKGLHGFRPCSEVKRAELSALIDDMRALDFAEALLCKEATNAVAQNCTAISKEYFPHHLGPTGLAHVPPAWLFVADPEQHCVFVADLSHGKLSAEQCDTPRICAGMPGEQGRADGEGLDARFRFPTAVAGDVDNLLLYISDTGNNRVAKVQLVWNDLRRQYSSQITTLHLVNTSEDEEAFKIPAPASLAVYCDLSSSLLVSDPASDTIFQIQLQPSLKAIGLSFASPYDQLIMMLKQSRREAENMPQVNVEHCKTLGRALDLLMSTPNIYQVEYVGGALDDDVARFLSDTYAPQGIQWEEDYDEDGSFTKDPASGPLRRRSSHRASVDMHMSTSKHPLEKKTAVVRFDNAPSKALGIEIHGLDSLEFNVFDASRISDDSGGVLVQVAMNVFSKYRFFPKYFGTPELVHRLIQFFSKVQAGYHRENHYHNHIHAADVLQTVHWLINTTGVVDKISDVDCVGVLLSAVIHDYDHPGVNNAFLVNSKDEIALHFNDQSVLENHHLYLTFQLLRVESYSILDSFTEHEQRIIRESMINHVLGTDMKNHFKSLGELKARAQALRDEGGDYMANADDKMLMLKSLLHAADISNPVKCKSLYLDWTKRVMKEFREQGSREEELDLAVSPFCDKDADVSKCQKGFIEFVVRPLFICLAEAYPALKQLLDNMDVNLQHWKDVEMVNTGRTPSFRSSRRKSSL